MEVEKISGVGEFTKTEKGGAIIYAVPEGKVFLVMRKNTVEVRTDAGLGKKLREEYESVMESRYFGRGGIEIVRSGQLSAGEIEDLVRLSYNLTKAE